MQKRIDWPTWATHIKLSGNGIELIAPRAQAEGLLNGDIEFIRQERLAEPKVNGVAVTMEKKKYQGKGKFIASQIQAGLDTKQIAEKVVDKFPDSGVDSAEQFRRALAYTRATRSRLKHATAH